MGIFKKIKKAVGSVFKGVGRAIKGVVKGIGSVLGKVFGKKWMMIAGLALSFFMPYIAPALSQMWTGFSTWASQVPGLSQVVQGLEWAGRTVMKGYGMVKDAFGSISDRFTNFFADIGKGNWQEGFGKLVGTVTENPSAFTQMNGQQIMETVAQSNYTPTAFGTAGEQASSSLSNLSAGTEIARNTTFANTSAAQGLMATNLPEGGVGLGVGSNVPEMANLSAIQGTPANQFGYTTPSGQPSPSQPSLLSRTSQALGALSGALGTPTMAQPPPLPGTPDLPPGLESAGSNVYGEGSSYWGTAYIPEHVKPLYEATGQHAQMWRQYFRGLASRTV